VSAFSEAATQVHLNYSLNLEDEMECFSIQYTWMMSSRNIITTLPTVKYFTPNINREKAKMNAVRISIPVCITGGEMWRIRGVPK